MRRIGDQPILKTNQMVDYKNYALTSYAHIPQNVLVKHLYSEIKEHVIFDHQLVDLKQEQNIQIKLKSKDNLINIQCERLYGCDGYNGFVRQALGIQMKGQQNIQSFLNIHFTSQELIKQTGEYGSMLHFIYNSNVVGVLIKHSIQNGEFALQIPLDLLYNGSDSLKIQQITKDNSLINQLINGITNKKLSDINVKSVGLWKMNAVIAEKYYDKNCILVGDACHSMPPAGGFGMNTGIQDAYNLAFKIYDNVDLSNYELERKQIAQQNIATALKYYNVSLDIAKQLGFSYSLLKNYQHITNMIPFASNQLFQFGIKLGSSFIENNFIYNQLKIKNQIPLVFPNEDIGYQYIVENILLNYGGFQNFPILKDTLILVHQVVLVNQHRQRQGNNYSLSNGILLITKRREWNFLILIMKINQLYDQTNTSLEKFEFYNIRQFNSKDNYHYNYM